MKTIFIITLIVTSLFAEYQSGKIDMHGGKEAYIYDKKKSSFGKSSMGMSMFMDKNASKKSKQIKKEK